MTKRENENKIISPSILWDIEDGSMTQDLADCLTELPIPEELAYQIQFGMSPELYEFVRSVLEGD